MIHARGGSLWPLLLVAGIAAVACLVASLAVSDHVAAMRVMREAPRATLAAPRDGPAIYRGVVFGPAGRKDQNGRDSAATWWWVSERVSKNTTKTVCFERQIEGLRLRDAGVELPITMFETAADLSLLGVGRGEDWDEPLLIDLGQEPRSTSKTMPPAAQRCAGERRTFMNRSLGQGVRVEVLACHQAGKLVGCKGPLAGVLAVGTMNAHRERRAWQARIPFFFITALSLSVLGGLVFRATRFRARTFAALGTGGRT